MRFDLLSPRPRKDKTYWLKVGAAFEAKGGGYNLVFDALPLPDNEGRVSVIMKEAEQKQRQEPSRSNDLDDDIPW